VESIFATLGAQLRSWRAKRKLSQPAVAQRLGRDRARISELERDLIGERWGRDRLTLFAEVCDVLNVVPVLVPRDRAADIRHLVEGTSESRFNRPIRSTFDELFVDLDHQDEDRG
jgi:transcriptional regulator with XRE-family HTH domain